MMHRRKKERKFRRGRVALVAAAALLTALLPAQAGFAANTAREAAQNCSITVTLPTDEEYAQLSNADVVLDFYQVAGAELSTKDDAYSFKYVTPFTDEKYAVETTVTTGVAAEVDDYTQLLAGVALSGVPEYGSGEEAGASAAPKYKEGVAVGETTSVDAGLYLIVPHGSDIADYKKTTSVGSSGKTAISTIAVAKGAAVYHFSPILVSVPNRYLTSADGTGTIEGNEEWDYPLYSENTAYIPNGGEEGTWNGQASIELKVGEEQYGSLRIVKTLDAHEKFTFNGRVDPATFVFKIRVTKDGVDYFNDVRTISYTTAKDYENALENAIEINNLPAGANVTIEESYSGTNYEQDGEIHYTVSGEDSGSVIPSGDYLEARIDNRRTDKTNGGGSITNKYSKAAGENGYFFDGSTPEATTYDEIPEVAETNPEEPES